MLSFGYKVIAAFNPDIFTTYVGNAQCAWSCMLRHTGVAFSVPLLVHGGTDMLVHCYYRNSEGVFLRCHTLQGYEDWVRSLHFKVCGKMPVRFAVFLVFVCRCYSDGMLHQFGIACAHVADDSSLLLAVASQDTLIRIWRISSKESQNTQTQQEALPDNEIKVRERLFVAEDKGKPFLEGIITAMARLHYAMDAFILYCKI